MPTCSQCRRRVWFWQASLVGGPCPRCRVAAVTARQAAARERAAARRAAFEQAGPARRAWLGAGRGALLGSIGLVTVAASLVALTAGPGVRYPFSRLVLGWALVSLGAVLIAALVGWWLSSWWFAVACLVGIGAAGGAITGACQGLRGQWDVFPETALR